MAKRLFKIIFCAAAVSILTSHVINAQNKFEPGGMQKIHKDEISLSGVSRLSDVFTLFNEWHTTTIDGYRWQISPIKTPFDQNQNWVLMLNGQRIDLNFFDMKNINFLPISSRNIDSMEVFSSAALFNGEFSDGGLINITTQKPSQGFSFYSEVFVGNESGDPGPYKYIDEYYSENIDIIGPDYSFGAGYGNDFITTSLNYKTNAYIYPSADSPIHYRVGGYQFTYRKVFADAFSAILDFPSLLSSPTLIAGYSGTGEYNIFSNYGSDLFFLNPLFKEVPADDKFSHLGLSGSFKLGNISKLNYTAKWSSVKMKNPTGFTKYMFDWQLDNYYFNAEYSAGNENFDYKIGAGISQSFADVNCNLTDNRVDLYKIYASVQTYFLENTNQSVDLALLNNGHGFAFKSSLINSIRLGKEHLFETKFSFSERLIEEDNNLWLWVQRGYRLPNDHNYIFNGAIANKSTNIFGEATWIYLPANNIKIELGAFYNRAFNMNYESNDLYFNPENKIISSTTYLIPEIDGNTFGLTLKAEQELSPQLSHTFYYGYSSEINSGSFYSDLLSVFPKHKLRYNAVFSNKDDFGINLNVTFLSASQWRDFIEIENESGGLYQSGQNYKLLCDVSMQKLFWEKRLKINMIFKNLLNRSNRYLPFGAYFDFSFFLRAELSIN